MGFFIEGLFIAAEERFKDGKPDGWTVAIATGVESYKVKVDDGLFSSAGLGGYALADRVRVCVKLRSFRDTIYFNAVSFEQMA